MTEILRGRFCRVCPVWYPDSEPRTYVRQHVCEGCRQRLERDLNALYEQEGILELTPGRGRAQKVSGTRSAPLPVKEASANLLGPGNPHVSEPKYETDALGRRRPLTKPYGDQIGELPIHIWVGEWIDCWGNRGGLIYRLEWACDNATQSAIDDFADELRSMLNATRSANNDHEQRPDYKQGVPCKRCDTKALYQDGGGEEYITCGKCGLLYTPAEYGAWLRLMSAWAKQLTKTGPDTPEAA